MLHSHIDPKINYRRLSELADEFNRFWSRVQAFYLDAVVGFSYVRKQVVSDQTWFQNYLKGTELATEEFQDTRVFTYSEIFSDDFCASNAHHATQGEVKKRNSPQGDNFVTLGQLCLVYFYDYWEGYLRKEYAVAKGVLGQNEHDPKVIEESLKRYATHDLWGDLRILRNSIVHNKGFATSDVARCKLIKWFKRGDAISITPEHMRSIFLALLTYRNQLFNEQFPECTIRLPLSEMKRR